MVLDFGVVLFSVVGSKTLGGRGRARESGSQREDWRRGRESEGRERGRDERERSYRRRESVNQWPGYSSRERHADRSPRRKKERRSRSPK